MKRNIISSDALTPADVPDEQEAYEQIIKFAFSYEGYRKNGGIDPCAEKANRWHKKWFEDGVLPGDLHTLRTCLFFEQRRFRHSGHPPEGEEMEYMQELLRAIRTIVS